MTSRELKSWCLFWAGDIFSRTVGRFFGQWFEWPYLPYSWLMNKSIDVQGDGPGPWSKPSANT